MEIENAKWHGTSRPRYIIYYFTSKIYNYIAACVNLFESVLFVI